MEVDWSHVLIFFSRAAPPCVHKLPINWEVSGNSAECDCEFSCLRKKTAPPDSVERDACVRQQVVPPHWHKCSDTLLCKCHSHPIKCSSDAIAHKGFPPIKFCVCYRFCFLLFFSSSSSLFWGHSVCLPYVPLQYSDRQTCELLQQHASCCGSLSLSLWFSWVMCVLVIHLQAVLTTYTLAIFTTMSACCLQCWLHFDYPLLCLLSSSDIILLGCSDKTHPFCLSANYSNRVYPSPPDDRLLNRW